MRCLRPFFLSGLGPARAWLSALMLGIFSASAVPLTISNPGFEDDTFLTNRGQLDYFYQSVSSLDALRTIPGWTSLRNPATGNGPFGGISDLGEENGPGQGSIENNIAWLLINNNFVANLSFVQTLSATIQTNTRYTLTLQAGEPGSFGNGQPRLFPVLGNAVTTGDVFARLRAGTTATPFPGFVSSLVPPPPDGRFTNWTLIWETGPSEPLAGQPIVIELFNQRTTGTGNQREVFYDDIAIDASPVLPPGLSIAVQGTNFFHILWPTNHTGYQLEAAASLMSPSWDTVTNGVTSTNGHYRVPVEANVGQRFYRLRKP